MSDLQKQGPERRIVVGVDGSSSSKEALRWAVQQAALTGAAVQAIMSWHMPLLVGGYAWPPVGVMQTTDFGELAHQVLTDAISEVTGTSPVPVAAIVQQGEAPQVLIDASDGADLLVMGSRGHGGFTEAMLGSVSQHCVHHASCPVVIIRGEVAPPPAPAPRATADASA